MHLLCAMIADHVTLPAISLLHFWAAGCFDQHFDQQFIHFFIYFILIIQLKFTFVL